MAFEPHPLAEERKASAVALVKLLLTNRTQEVLQAHLRELLRILVWKITESEAHKYKTRFQTQGAINCPEKRLLRHEHVYQSAKMIDRLLAAKIWELDEILKDAVGCTVTADEHRELENFDDDYGWDRYRKAKLIVIDTQTGERKL